MSSEGFPAFKKGNPRALRCLSDAPAGENHSTAPVAPQQLAHPRSTVSVLNIGKKSIEDLQVQDWTQVQTCS